MGVSVMYLFLCVAAYLAVGSVVAAIWFRKSASHWDIYGDSNRAIRWLAICIWPWLLICVVFCAMANCEYLKYVVDPVKAINQYLDRRETERFMRNE